MYETEETADELRDVLRRNGFVRCDIPACNCGSWHARYGLPERMAELKEAMADAGHPLTNKNHNLISHALRDLIADRDAMRGFADLWYFAMDDAPGDFERIVTTYSPAHWMSEIAKIRKARNGPNEIMTEQTSSDT